MEVIPKAFTLFAQRIPIVWDKELINEDDAWGHAAYRRNVIRLQPSTEGQPRTPQQVEHTFWHEVLHLVFYLLGDYCVGDVRLREDETLIGLLSHAIQQILETAEYEVEE